MTSYVIIILLATILNVAHSRQSEFSAINLVKNIPTECPEYDDPNVNVHIAHESDCSKFYQCSNGEKIPKSCQKGLHFNPKLQVCDHPISAGCIPGNPPTTSSTAPSTTTTQSTTTSTTSTTTTSTPQTTSSTTPSTTTISTTPTTTSSTPPTTSSTTPSTTTNQSTTISTTPTTTSSTPPTTSSTTPSTTTTQSTTTSTTPSTTTTQSTTTSTTPTTTSSTPPTTSSTSSTTPSTTTTQSTTISTTSSTITSTIPSATSSTTPSTTTPVTGYPTTCPKYDTPDRIFLPHECICFKYYACYKGLQILQQCPPNQHFNPSKHVCEDSENAGCQNVTPSTVKPSTIAPDPPSSQGCPANNIGQAVHLPHETNCSLFYKCNFGVKVCQKCPAGLYFDPKLEVCNWADQVDCISTSFYENSFCENNS